MSKSLALLALALLAASIFLTHKRPSQNMIPEKVQDAFYNWLNQYPQNWEDAQIHFRMAIFERTFNKIEKHNADPTQTYEMGLNQFSCLTQAEFEEQYLGLLAEQPENYEVIENESNDVDWRDKGAVNPVKNQGACGSCWAFSAVGALEGLSKISTGTLGNFAEQQLVDCSRSYGNQGCNGGLMTYAFAYIRDKGIVNQNDYPYVARDQACKKDGGSYKVSGFTNVGAGNCNQQVQFLEKQVVSVAVDASNWSSYRSGVFSNCSTRLNHGVTLVAVKSDIWYIKNSWGGSWGETGFMRLAKGNTCGICAMSTVPNK